MLGVLVMQRFRLQRSKKGIFYGLMVGILSAVGQLAMFAAYGTGSNAAVITDRDVLVSAGDRGPGSALVKGAPY
jgi:hypothetical protein